MSGFFVAAFNFPAHKIEKDQLQKILEANDTNPTGKATNEILTKYLKNIGRIVHNGQSLQTKK
ncbi:hypothetical protein D1632_17325 [Chryseobacterium nematophagum]|uniref:Uncharacterized protein n=1 Tax=Chryseobacterium nematophagum TaxID=2305228 RepID=A0A3M7L936_9FLAO|nr:hypothetical protein [Chryseobacterium nematophagum]RMZ58052.1 hypothetical protein D1632_17325 [Chryseobacterium nematophagum]